MKFSVPIVYTITGWITMTAKSVDQLEKDVDGVCVDISSIHDPAHTSELFPLEAKPIKAGK